MPDMRSFLLGRRGMTEALDHGSTVVPTDRPPAKPPRRPRWRLRILLALNAFVASLFVFSQLDPSTVKKLGPVGDYVFDLLRPSGEPEDVSPAGRRLNIDVRALGGEANFMGRTYGFLGLFGPSEQFHVRLNQTEVGDDELAALVKKHGDRIWGLDLRNTRITDQGLRHLKGLSQIEQLTLGNDDSRFSPSHAVPISPITDSGLVHLKGLTRLSNLNLSGLPITDSGLDALGDLPQLGGLYLSRTKIKGLGLGRLNSLPTLVLLYLDASDLTDEGISSLVGASNLQFLSVSRVPLTPKGLQSLQSLPRLNQLDLTGCGLLDEEVRDLKRSKPGLEIIRN
jgi:hypothetical protein